MVKLDIYKQEDNPTPVVSLMLTKRLSGDIVVVDETSGYDLVGFRVVEGKVSLIRYAGVHDANVFNVTPTDRQLVEVRE